MLWPRLDQEYQLGAFLHAVNHRWGEFGAARDEANLRGQALVATVAGYADDIAILELGEHSLRCKKPDFQIARRQQCNNRPSSRHGFARPVIDLFDSAL